MTIPKIEMEVPPAVQVETTEDTLVVELQDGRTISVTLAWYPRLLHASPRERKRWRLIGGGEGIHWEAIDEDISIEHILSGRPSGESRSSLTKWLASRGTQRRRAPVKR